MKYKHVIISIFCLLSCSKADVMLDDLLVKNSRYFKDSSSVYSGYGVTKFEDGQISNKIFIKDGIPSGPWTAYGYQGEIIQYGTFKPVILPCVNIREVKNICRINLCEINEDDQNFTDIFVISNDLQEDIDKTKDKRFVNSILNYLKSKNVTLSSFKVRNVIAMRME